MKEALAIGPAAAALRIEPHVLRHWEDVGVLVPGRTVTGHRRYDDELLTRARLIRLCQRAGLSLTDIRSLYAADRTADRHRGRQPPTDFRDDRQAATRRTIPDARAGLRASDALRMPTLHRLRERRRAGSGMASRPTRLSVAEEVL